MCVLLSPVTQVPSRSGEQRGRRCHVMVSRLLGPFEAPNFEVLRHQGDNSRSLKLKMT